MDTTLAWVARQALFGALSRQPKDLTRVRLEGAAGELLIDGVPCPCEGSGSGACIADLKRLRSSVAAMPLGRLTLILKGGTQLAIKNDTGDQVDMDVLPIDASSPPPPRQPPPPPPPVVRPGPRSPQVSAVRPPPPKSAQPVALRPPPVRMAPAVEEEAEEAADLPTDVAPPPTKLDLAEVGCDRKALLHVLEEVSRLLPKKPSLDVLKYVQLSTEGERLWVVGTDLERWAILSVACRGALPEARLVPAILLVKYLKAGSESVLRLRLEGEHLVASAGKGSSTKLKTMAPGEFPRMPVDLPVVVPPRAVEGALLCAAVKAVAPCIATDETRPDLCAVDVEPLRGASTVGHPVPPLGKGLFKLRATDSHRGAWVFAPLPTGLGAFTLPRPSVSVLSRRSACMLVWNGDGTSGVLSVYEAGGLFLLPTGDHATYPRLDQVVGPLEEREQVTLPIAPLTQAIGKLKPLWDGLRNHTVALGFKPGAVRVSAESCDGDKGHVDFPCPHSSSERVWMGDAKYLLNALELASSSLFGSAASVLLGFRPGEGSEITDVTLTHPRAGSVIMAVADETLRVKGTNGKLFYRLDPAWLPGGASSPTADDLAELADAGFVKTQDSDSDPTDEASPAAPRPKGRGRGPSVDQSVVYEVVVEGRAHFGLLMSTSTETEAVLLSPTAENPARIVRAPRAQLTVAVHGTADLVTLNAAGLPFAQVQPPAVELEEEDYSEEPEESDEDFQPVQALAVAEPAVVVAEPAAAVAEPAATADEDPAEEEPATEEQPTSSAEVPQDAGVRQRLRGDLVFLSSGTMATLRQEVWPLDTLQEHLVAFFDRQNNGRKWRTWQEVWSAFVVEELLTLHGMELLRDEVDDAEREVEARTTERDALQKQVEALTAAKDAAAEAQGQAEEKAEEKETEAREVEGTLDDFVEVVRDLAQLPPGMMDAEEALLWLRDKRDALWRAEIRGETTAPLAVAPPPAPEPRQAPPPAPELRQAPPPAPARLAPVIPIRPEPSIREQKQQQKSGGGGTTIRVVFRDGWRPPVGPLLPADLAVPPTAAASGVCWAPGCGKQCRDEAHLRNHFNRFHVAQDEYGKHCPLCRNFVPRSVRHQLGHLQSHKEIQAVVERDGQPVTAEEDAG